MEAMRNIRVVACDPAWPLAFEREAALLAEILGPELVAIHHIGSTSVPGLSAKPIIDIMPLVRDIERVDVYNAAMSAAGYEAWGEYGIAGRRYFTRGGPLNRSHNIHVFEEGSPNADRHLAFRDYLRTHPDESQSYAELKLGLAHQFPDDIYGYMNGKDAFVKAMEARALAWAAIEGKGKVGKR